MTGLESRASSEDEQNNRHRQAAEKAGFFDIPRDAYDFKLIEKPEGTPELRYFLKVEDGLDIAILIPFDRTIFHHLMLVGDRIKILQDAGIPVEEQRPEG